MTDPTAPLPDEELAAIEARDAAATLDDCENCHEYGPGPAEADRRALLAALRAERAARERLRTAVLDYLWSDDDDRDRMLAQLMKANDEAALAPATGEGAE